MLLRFSLPAVLTCALPGTSIWLANSILARQPDGYSQVAFLSAAYQLRNALLLIPTTIGNASTPLMSCLNAARDTPGLRRAFRTAIGMSVVCTFLGIVPMLVFSRHLMGLFGPDFSGKEVVLNIMVLGAGMLAIQLPIGNLIVGIGNMWVGLIINLLWAAVLLTSTWVLVGQGRGATGAAIAQLVAYGFHLISNGSYAVRLLSRSRAAVPLTVE